MERTTTVRRVLTAATIAIITEAVLCLIFIALGRISWTRSEDTNFIGVATLILHLPGMLLSRLFHLQWTRPGMMIAAVTGALQWFLVSLVALSLRKRSRGHGAA